MRCKYCGGEINLSVGRCITCGRGVDATSDIRILHDLGSIAEQYGLDPDLEKYSVPLYSESSEDEPQEEQRTYAVPLLPDLKQARKPGIELSTYYELLGYDPDGNEISPSPAEDSTDNGISAELPAQSDEQETTDSEEAAISGYQHDEARDEYVITGEEAETSEEEHPSWLRSKAELLLDRIDHLTSPVTERIRLWYSAQMPKMNRALNSDTKHERLMVICVLAAAVVLVVGLTSAIIAAIPDSVIGEWKVSEEDSRSVVTVEFTRSEVIARIYDENGDAHIYRRGKYKTSHSNGRDLMTIEYEDGTLSNLYFELSGKTGVFVNVGTGTSATYELMD